LSFCNWHKWKDRSQIENSEFPGVYMISITNKNLKGKPNYNDVSYIGMTNLQKLKSRWTQFDNSIRGKKWHSGGIRVYNEFGNYDSWKENLFVCAMPIKCNPKKAMRTPEDLRLMGECAYLEYEAIARFKEKAKRSKRKLEEPEYNKK